MGETPKPPARPAPVPAALANAAPSRSAIFVQSRGKASVELEQHDASEPPPISGTMGVRPHAPRARPAVLSPTSEATPLAGMVPKPAPTGERSISGVLASDGSILGAHVSEPPQPPAQMVAPPPTDAPADPPAQPFPLGETPRPPAPPPSYPRETRLPSDSLPDPARRPVAHKPLLASEALMEDLAPVEPARRRARGWCAGVGAASLLIGGLPLLGVLGGGMTAAIPWFVTGAIAVVAGVTPVTYRQRAVAMVVLGLLTGVVALQGAGGALMLADGGSGWGLARLFTAVAIPAALLFRAQYRAYAGARIFLGLALCVSLPFAVHTVFALFDGGGVTTAAAVLVLGILAGSLAGFMGSETTGAGAYMAYATLIGLALDLGVRGLGKGPLIGVATGAVAFGGAAALASLGGFQILAWRFAADARRIDLHSPRRDSMSPESRREPPSDWSTRN